MHILDYVLLPAVLYTLYTDIKYGKIKNYITFPLMGVGLFYHFYTNGMLGLWFSIKGLLLCGLISIFMSIGAKLGMGDTKLFMAIGAIKGFRFTLDVMAFSFLISIFASAMFRPKQFKKAVTTLWTMIMIKFYTKKMPELSEEHSALKLPFAVFISLGLIIAYLLGGEFIWDLIQNK